MTNKELKRLSRRELLEIMLMQSKKIESLQQQLDNAKGMLEERKIINNNAGSIAEASLMINQVFESAQKSADQYLENIKRMEEEAALLCKKKTEETEKISQELVNISRKKIYTLVKSIEDRLIKESMEFPGLPEIIRDVIRDNSHLELN